MTANVMKVYSMATQTLLCCEHMLWACSFLAAVCMLGVKWAEAQVDHGAGAMVLPDSIYVSAWSSAL